ncbi:ATP-binding protein, Mrp/Nbp35 family [Listeria cornellensis FSL F6-0969]|uniref:ATP-binding protein, Mrp/Nbp35 family n=1 Tax=Listeria cornellensis FSL F6-0969 TaxID=1265820 RepID=W7BQ00_9LIST|nr:ATP-binding protein, Mrp/Nbp35 family [Listeria cornellensis FSL F6-0969]
MEKVAEKKVATELETELLGIFPIEQPEHNENGYLSGVYEEDSMQGRRFLELARKINQHL